MFGNAQQGQTGGGGLFGSTSTSTGTGGGGLFGNNTNQNQQNQGGGLFGNSTTQPQQQQGGGLFGSTTNQGQPSTGGGLFGSTTNNTNQTSSSTAPTGGGLFGNASTNTSNPLFGGGASGNNPLLGGGGGGLFGGSKPAGSLFGQPTNTTNNNTTAGSAPSIFGQPQNQQQNQQQSGSLFGQPPKPAGSLFGSVGQPATNTGGGGLFGNSLAPSNAANPLLSSTSRGSVGPAQPQVDAQSQFAQLTQRIEGIAQAWNSSSPQCRFQHYFYNLVDPNQVNLYGRPPNATNEELWQKAVRENPDRSCLVPVVAVGFDDLQQRVNAQSQQAASHQEKLKELKSRIEALSQRHDVSNASRLHRAAALQTQLQHRLLQLTQHLHLLIPALRSSAIRPEEEALRTALEEIEEEIRAGRMRGKLNELWALVGAVNAVKERKRSGEAGMEWAVVDEEGLGQIAQILTEQQTGLNHLTKIVQRDMKDLSIILGTGSASQEEDMEQMFSSTSTLRASSLR
ncbi:hypothetical protein PLICRDRAFT_51753 [Plicaturopsis crispa FD-325 SS-3]|nr:hypothetical protein PLICRDRAFT_51753 [Plicaturopsis crispa FD-325 SS-3]